MKTITTMRNSYEANRNSHGENENIHSENGNNNGIMETVTGKM